MLRVWRQPGPHRADLTCCSFSLISRCSAEAAACLARSSAEAAVRRRSVSTICARSSFSCGGGRRRIRKLTSPHSSRCIYTLLPSTFFASESPSGRRRSTCSPSGSDSRVTCSVRSSFSRTCRSLSARWASSCGAEGASLWRLTESIQKKEQDELLPFCSLKTRPVVSKHQLHCDRQPVVPRTCLIFLSSSSLGGSLPFSSLYSAARLTRCSVRSLTSAN